MGVLLLVFGLGIGISSSGGFSTTETERSVNVAVVDDERAYVGYDSPQSLSVNASEEVDEEIVTISNRFHTPITEVSVDTGDADIDYSISSPQIGVGESSSVILEGCDESLDSEPVHITIEVEGDTVYAEISGETETRTVEVDCYS